MRLGHISRDRRRVSSGAEESRLSTLKDLPELIQCLRLGMFRRLNRPKSQLGGIPSGLDHVDVSEPGEPLVDVFGQRCELLDVVGGRTSPGSGSRGRVGYVPAPQRRSRPEGPRGRSGSGSQWNHRTRRCGCWMLTG
jgi:hypothetical protein